MTDRELLEMALEALEYHTAQTRPIYETNRIIEALRARLAEPVQEPVAEDNLPPMPDPVAWQFIDRMGEERNAPLFAEWQMRSYARVAVDLAAPPTRRPLTDESGAKTVRIPQCELRDIRMAVEITFRGSPDWQQHLLNILDARAALKEAK